MGFFDSALGGGLVALYNYGNDVLPDSIKPQKVAETTYESITSGNPVKVLSAETEIIKNGVKYAYDKSLVSTIAKQTGVEATLVSSYNDAKSKYSNPLVIASATGQNIYKKLNEAEVSGARTVADFLKKNGFNTLGEAVEAGAVVMDNTGNYWASGMDTINKTVDDKTTKAKDTVKKAAETAVDTAKTVIENTAGNAIGTAVKFGTYVLDNETALALAADNFFTGGLAGIAEDGLQKILDAGKKTNDAIAGEIGAAVTWLTDELAHTKIDQKENKSKQEYADDGEVMYILPGSGEPIPLKKDDPRQSLPLNRYYSPRLFGAPPQLTNQCDMRIKSSHGGVPGAVGDYYLTKVLQDAQIAYFAVGRARFMGGFSSLSNLMHQMAYYGNALRKYNIFDPTGASVLTGDRDQFNNIVDEETYKSAYGTRDIEEFVTKTDEKGSTVLDIDNMEGIGILDAIGGMFAKGVGFLTKIKAAYSLQQPFFTYEDDWPNYINNVKMMINSAVIMLGLQNACVREGDYYYPLGMNVKFDKNDTNDAWSNYRYITVTEGFGDALQKSKDTGDTVQYVSYMIDPAGVTESYSNNIGPSQIFSSVINSGSSIGSEIAFISNSTAGSADDKVINLAKESKEAAEEILKNLGGSGNGRFTAAIASSMARSFTGDHTIYPEVFQGHSSTSSMSITVHLTSDAGDPYSYLINILVPTFFILGMALPQMSEDNASAYSYPPVIQCNIPGMWGTRLGMVESVSFNKNPNGKDVSINGYPLQVDVSINIKDLQHVLVTSPMTKPSLFLNNTTMFDYIAQIAGVDRYKANGAMRTITKLALMHSYEQNMFNNIGDALLSDWHSLSEKIFAWNRGG